MNRNDSLNLQRNQSDLDRVARSIPSYEPRTIVLGQITGATLMPAQTYRYVYQWREAEVARTTPLGGTLYTPNNKSVGLTGEAISISELSNNIRTAGNQEFSYGVNEATLPAGFLPAPIPVDQYVLLTPYRATNGTLFWFIINTQAIDGECSPP